MHQQSSLTPQHRKEAYVWAKSILRNKWTEKKNYQLGSGISPLYPLVCKILAEIWTMYPKQHEALGDNFSYNTLDQFPEFYKTKPADRIYIWWPMNEQGIQDRMNALDMAISEVNQLINAISPQHP